MSKTVDSNTELDAALESARAASQEKSSSGFSLGGLVESLEKDLDSKKVNGESAAEIKKRIREKLKIGVDKLIEANESSQELDYLEHGMSVYAQILGDEKRFTELESTRMSRYIDEAGMRDALVSEYNSMGGTETLEVDFPEIKNNPNMRRSKSEAERDAQINMERVKPQKGLTKESFFEELPTYTIKKAVYKALEGFGVSALEAGDLATAGEAFGRFEGGGTLKPEMVKKIHDVLEGATDEKKRVFVRGYRQGKVDAAQHSEKKYLA